MISNYMRGIFQRFENCSWEEDSIVVRNTDNKQGRLIGGLGTPCLTKQTYLIKFDDGTEALEVMDNLRLIAQGIFAIFFENDVADKLELNNLINQIIKTD